MTSHSSARGRLEVLVADSSPLRLQLLARALRRRSEFHVVTCLPGAGNILNALESSIIHVAVIATHSHDQTWHVIPMIRSVHLAHPEVAKVVLLEDCNRELVVGAFRYGARGLFCQSDSFGMLCKCLEAVHDGQIWASNEQMQWIIDALTSGPLPRMVNTVGQHGLSDREQQIAALVAEGLRNRDIAYELKLTENTVKKYLFFIFGKLGISTRVELAIYVSNNGMCLKGEWIQGRA